MSLLKRLLSRLPAGVITSLSMQGSIALLTFLSTWQIARYGGDKGFGLYSLVFAWLSLLGLAATWGCDDLLIQRFAQKDQAPATLARLWTWALKRVVLAALGLSAVFLLWLAWLPSGALGQYFWYFVLGLPVLPASALLLLGQAALRGRAYWWESQVGEKLAQPLIFILLLPLLGSFLVLDDAWLIASRSLSFVLPLGLLAWLLYRRLPWLSGEREAEAQPDWPQEAKAYLANTLLFALSTRLDLLYMGFWGLDEAIVGHYNLGLKISELCMIPFVALGAVAMPRFATYYREGELTKLQQFYRQITRLGFGSGLALIALMLAFGPWLLALYGKSFDAAYGYLQIMVGGKALYFFLGPMNLLLLMTAQTKRLNHLIFFNILLALGLYPLSLWQGGAYGAAWVNLGLSLLLYLQMAWLVWRALRFRPGI